MKYPTYILAAATVATLALGAMAEAHAHGLRDGRRAHDAPIVRFAYPQEFNHYIDRRQKTQRARIRNGRHSGQLTRKELRWLRWDQRRIAGMERKFAADGSYSRQERRLLARALDRASYRIKWAKHNRRSYRHHAEHHRWDSGDRYGPGSRRHTHRHNRLILAW